MTTSSLKFGRGYDRNWELDRQGKDLELVASVYEPTIHQCALPLDHW
jgi:hypothetical protein